MGVIVRQVLQKTRGCDLELTAVCIIIGTLPLLPLGACLTASSHSPRFVSIVCQRPVELHLLQRSIVYADALVAFCGFVVSLS